MTHEESRRRRAEWAQQVDDGACPSDVAVANKVRPGQVYEACHEHGVTWDDQRTERSSLVHPFAVLAHLRKGGTLQSIGNKLGLTRQRVHQIKQRAIEHGVL